MVRFGSRSSNRLDPSPVDPVFTYNHSFPIGAAAALLFSTPLPLQSGPTVVACSSCLFSSVGTMVVFTSSLLLSATWTWKHDASCCESQRQQTRNREFGSTFGLVWWRFSFSLTLVQLCGPLRGTRLTAGDGSKGFGPQSDRSRVHLGLTDVRSIALSMPAFFLSQPVQRQVRRCRQRITRSALRVQRATSPVAAGLSNGFLGLRLAPAQSRPVPEDTRVDW